MYPWLDGQDEQGEGVNTTGWQSFGADCVSSVVNKLVMTLFPANHAFAKLELTPEAKALLREEDKSLLDARAPLINAVKQAMYVHANVSGRVALGQHLKHLVVGGNACLYLPKEGTLISYPLSRYVNARDKSGNLTELIIEESKAIGILHPAIRAVVEAKLNSEGKRVDEDTEVKIYTRSKLAKDGFFLITQEILGDLVGEQYRVSPDNLPFIPVRYETNYGEDYGRSLVELYAGDFHAVQFLTEAVAKGMILMADIKYLIKQGSATDVDHLINSPTGEYVTGNIDDIGILQLEKYADFTSISSVLDKYERRLGKRFMIGAARDAERVTTVEIRRDALEMEASLDGAYTMLAATLQKPYFRLLLNRIGFDLPENLVNTVITTGLEALSELGDADKYIQWVEAMNAASQLPERLQARMKWGDLALHTANQLALELPFLMSEKEFQETQAAERSAMQEQQMTEAAAKAAPQMIANNNQTQ
jgi:hypothetical protein